MAPRPSVDFSTIHDPPQPRLHGLLLTWDNRLLAQFVKAANAVVLVENPTLELPLWVTESRGRHTARGFVQDCMVYLSEISGGVNGTLLSPLTPIQSLQLSRRLGQIEMHPFMQACANMLPNGSILASGTQFFDDPGTDGIPTNLPGPPSPYRQIFS